MGSGLPVSRSSVSELVYREQLIDFVYHASMSGASSISLSRWAIEYVFKPCSIAGCFVVVALLWTFPLQHIIAYPFVFLFFGAIMGSAWFGGVIAGFMAVVLSSLTITYFFIPPLFSITVAKESQSFLTAFILSAIAIAIVSSSRKRAETIVRDARDSLETTVQERTAELLRSNQEIQESERKLRIVTEGIPQQIWRADNLGRIEYSNQHLLNYIGGSAESLLGELFSSILHTEDAPLFNQSWEAAVAAGERFEYEARVRGADGAFRWFLVRSIPHRSHENQVAHWFGIHIDIEDQHRAQQRLLSAHEDLSRFSRTMSLAQMAASIAHELNQPLTAVITHASACRRWLRAEPANLARATAAADSVVEETTRAANVVRRVRSLLGKTDSIRESTDLNSLIMDLARLLRDDAVRRGVLIKLRLAENLPHIEIDPVQIQQVLLNLAMNGMEAMTEASPPKVLEICTREQNYEEVAVSIKDYGPGFSERVKSSMFEPFFTTKPEGTGIGLSICRSIIEAHDGRIWAERTEHGTVFEFALKVSQ
jgi:PAS domain S-box-containing protein